MKRVVFETCAILLAGTAGLSVTLVSSSSDAFWLTVLWGAWVLTVAWSFTRPAFSLAFASITTAMLLFVILPATVAVRSGLTAIAGSNYGAGTTAALRMAALAQCALLCGAIVARTVCPRATFVRLRPTLSPARLDRATRAAVGVGMLGLLLFAVVARANVRDFFVFTTTTGYGAFSRSAAGTQIGYFSALQLVAGLAFVLVALRFTSAAPGARSIAVFLGLVSTLLLLGGGQRGRFLVPVLAAGLVWFKTTHRPIGPRRLAVIGALAMLLISAIVGVARGAAGQRTLSADNVIAAPFGSGSDLFSPLAGLAQTVPSQIPYLDGSSYLEIFVFPVPRFLWHAKPEGAISTVVQTFDPRDAGLAFPEFGEMYANFGLPGVVIGSLLLGLLVEWLWIRLARSPSLRESVLISVCFAVLLQLFVRGAIAPMLVSFGGLLIATLVVCMRGSRTLSSPPTPMPSVAHSVEPAIAG